MGANTRLTVGIDIAKASFEASFDSEDIKGKPPHLSEKNTPGGFEQLVRWAKKHALSSELHFCMESTGGYEFALASYLASQGLLVSVENPRRIKHFGIAKGAFNKTDSSDARIIAAYAKNLQPRPWHLSDEVRRELSGLSRSREQVQVKLTRAQNHQEHLDALPPLRKAHLQAEVQLFQTQLIEIEQRQRELVNESPELAKEIELLTGIKGVGLSTAIVILSEMPDVRGYDTAETWAANAGLFPCKRESGQWKGRTVMSKAGNAHVRRALYMGITVAKRYCPVIKTFAERLESRGKSKKQIRVACMRKILLRSYGILKAHHQGKIPFYTEPDPKLQPDP